MFSTKLTLPYHQYQRLEGAQSPSLEKGDAEEQQPSRHTAGDGVPQISLPIAVYALFVCTGLAFILGWHLPPISNADAWCTQRLSQPSPVTRDVAIEYSAQHFNGSLLKENVYRQAAGPEVDAAWAALGVNCELLGYHCRKDGRI